jgi:two-component system alkaline phosphatase synthesis response regulator PhoP
MASPQDKLVLVVEDEPDVRLFLQTVLEDGGFRVITAGDGDEAWQLIQERRPDFISLDLVLPKKSGHKLLRVLQQHREYSKIPVLIVTAHAKDDLGKPMMESIFGGAALLGPGMYLEKPVKPASYLRCVKQALGIPCPEDEGDGGVRQQLLDVIRSADRTTLERVVGALKKG